MNLRPPPPGPGDSGEPAAASASAPPARPRRPICVRCERPLATCLCALVVPVANTVPVRLLQHPLEVHQAKGSTRLLGLCLQRFSQQVGEHFDAAELAGWLHAPMPGDDAPAPRQPVLLYPDIDDGAPALAPGTPAQAVQLVVLDGTWRKSRRMLALNPLLAGLPRLALAPQTLNRYAALRKAPRPGQLSTLEATALALDQLEGTAGPDGAEGAEGAPGRYTPLLDALDRFVAAQTAWRPAAPLTPWAGSGRR